MKRIAIVAGGDSSESEVSLRSAAGLMTFIPDEYEKYIVSITGGDWKVHLLDSVTTLIDKNDFSFVKEGRKTTFDFAISPYTAHPAKTVSYRDTSTL